MPEQHWNINRKACVTVSGDTAFVYVVGHGTVNFDLNKLMEFLSDQAWAADSLERAKRLSY